MAILPEGERPFLGWLFVLVVLAFISFPALCAFCGFPPIGKLTVNMPTVPMPTILPPAKPTSITWEQYLEDCGTKRQLAPRNSNQLVRSSVRSTEDFTLQYEGKLIRWHGTFVSADQHDSRSDIVVRVRMSPRDTTHDDALSDSDIDLDVPVDLKPTVLSLYPGARVVFEGRLVSQGGMISNHGITVSSLAEEAVPAVKPALHPAQPVDEEAHRKEIVEREQAAEKAFNQAMEENPNGLDDFGQFLQRRDWADKVMTLKMRNGRKVMVPHPIPAPGQSLNQKSDEDDARQANPFLFPQRQAMRRRPTPKSQLIRVK